MRLISCTLLFWSLLSSNLFAEDAMLPYYELSQESMEKAYWNEIHALNESSFDDVYAELDDDSVLVVRGYTDGDENLYDLSLVIAVVDKESTTIKQSYLHKNIASSDAVYISGISVDTTTYQEVSDGNIIAVTISFSGSSRVDGYQAEELFLYTLKDNIVAPILEAFPIKTMNGQSDMGCHYIDQYNNYSFDKEKSLDRYPTLVFQHSYWYESYSCENDDSSRWDKTFDNVQLTYSKGKYATPTEKPLFDLREIEANAKNGKHYSLIALEALLWNQPAFSKSNILAYNNIAYYLQLAGHNKEAVYLLEVIIAATPNRSVSYINLGDAYWGIGNKHKARAAYRKYAELMKKNGKSARIPKWVPERLALNYLPFDKNFKQTHTKKVPIPPALMKDIHGVKAVKVIPWQQKTLLSVEGETIIKAIPFIEGGELEFIYFTSSQVDDTGVNIKVYGYDRTINKPFFIDEQKGVASSYISNNIIVYPERDYLVTNDTVYFGFDYDIPYVGDPYEFNYAYEYTVGHGNIIEPSNYIETDEKIHKVYNHARTAWFGTSAGGFSYSHWNNIDLTVKLDENPVGFSIGLSAFSQDDRYLYFDNHGFAYACIWRYDTRIKELSKIVPEHEARTPMPFTYKGKEYVVYVENQSIKVATP